MRKEFRERLEAIRKEGERLEGLLSEVRETALDALAEDHNSRKGAVILGDDAFVPEGLVARDRTVHFTRRRLREYERGLDPRWFGR